VEHYEQISSQTMERIMKAMEGAQLKFSVALQSPAA
jgi:hypothetical protein